MKAGNVDLVLRKYEASGGEEMFISFEDKKIDKLVGLLRLRFPGSTFIPELRNAAIIREVHVYGSQIPVGAKGRESNKQHSGWGGKLMNEAEKLAKKAGFSRIAVISGVGTRQYYARTGYRLEGTYMLKDLQ